MALTKRHLQKLKAAEEKDKKAVFNSILAAQGTTVCSRVRAMKASRDAGKPFLQAPRKSTQPSKPRPRPAKKRAKTADPCENVTTVNKLIKCMEKCCKSFDGKK